MGECRAQFAASAQWILAVTGAGACSKLTLYRRTERSIAAPGLGGGRCDRAMQCSNEDQPASDAQIMELPGGGANQRSCTCEIGIPAADSLMRASF
jgi:hypothetical protein